MTLDSDMTPGERESDMTGDATEQMAVGPETASQMGSSGASGSGAGAFGSAAEVSGSVISAAGAVTENGQRLRLVFPPAPGGAGSPQIPGETPDYSTIPDERVVRSPHVAAVHHPDSEAGTAAGIMGLSQPAGREAKPEDFELGLTSFEEQRKSRPALESPVRPQQTVAVLNEASWVNPELGSGSEPPRPLSALTRPNQPS